MTIPGKYVLPADIAAKMARFGRYEFDPKGCGEDFNTIWSEVQSPLMSFAMGDPAGFVAALADAVLPVGGWAVFGAARAIDDMVSPHSPYPRAEDVLDAGLEFLRGNIPLGKVPQAEWERWLAKGGTADTWLP